jgi:hypothetical protein
VKGGREGWYCLITTAFVCGSRIMTVSRNVLVRGQREGGRTL